MVHLALNVPVARASAGIDEATNEGGLPPARHAGHLGPMPEAGPSVEPCEGTAR